MLRVALALALLGLCLANLDAQWDLFKTTHNKQYATGEESHRRSAWEANVDYIQKHNIEADMGKHSYTLGVNKYADLTGEEYSAHLLGYTNKRITKGATFLRPSNVAIPDTVDWRDKGYVTPIKDQKQCGSCWAFSATGSLEGQWFKKTNNLVSLSEQNLVDCSTKEGDHGCGGGLMDDAFKYIKENGGIDTEASYPYLAKNANCSYSSANRGATATGYTDITKDDEEALKEAVATIGPISVAIDASKSSFHLYKSGIYTEIFCSSDRLDHGVLAVGYGSGESALFGKQDYWLVKNSWGLTWGDKGYIKMARNFHNMCGIAHQASYPLV